MPRLRLTGLPPAATARRPSWTIACARTVAVVVPSPATSLVLVATSLASWAPRFSYESSSSTSRAIVTPSLVIVGAPNFLSMTTLRPLGPSVTLTVSARASTPRSSRRRALSSNSRILGMETKSLRTATPRAAPASGTGRGAGCHDAVSGSLGDDGEHVARGEDQQILAVVLDLGAAVLRVQDLVADADVERDALLAGVVPPAVTDSEDLALLRLLFGGVRDDEAGCGGLLRVQRL